MLPIAQPVRCLWYRSVRHPDTDLRTVRLRKSCTCQASTAGFSAAKAVRSLSAVPACICRKCGVSAPSSSGQWNRRAGQKPDGGGRQKSRQQDKEGDNGRDQPAQRISLTRYLRIMRFPPNRAEQAFFCSQQTPDIVKKCGNPLPFFLRQEPSKTTDEYVRSFRYCCVDTVENRRRKYPLPQSPSVSAGHRSECAPVLFDA